MIITLFLSINHHLIHLYLHVIDFYRIIDYNLEKVMKDKDNILEDLYSDSEIISSEELFELLKPFIRLNKKTGQVIFLDDAMKLNLEERILIFLLGKKALFMLGELESEEVSPKVIVSETGISRGSVLPTLKRLREERSKKTVNVTAKGHYFIAPYQFEKIKKKIKHGKKDN